MNVMDFCDPDNVLHRHPSLFWKCKSNLVPIFLTPKRNSRSGWCWLITWREWLFFGLYLVGSAVIQSSYLFPEDTISEETKYYRLFLHTLNDTSLEHLVSLDGGLCYFEDISRRYATTTTCPETSTVSNTTTIIASPKEPANYAPLAKMRQRNPLFLLINVSPFYPYRGNGKDTTGRFYPVPCI